MKSNREYVISIDMALKGTKDIQNRLKNLMLDTDVVRKRFEELNIDSIMGGKVEALKAKLVKAYNTINEELQTRPEGDDAIKAVFEEQLRALSENILELERLKQVSKSALSAQEEAFRQNLSLLDEYGIKLKGIGAKYNEAMMKTKASGNTSAMAKLNAELDNRAAKLLKVKKLQDTMSNLDLGTEEAARYTAELNNIEKLLTDMNVPLKEAVTRMQNLKVDPKLLADIKSFKTNINGMKDDLLKTKNSLNENSAAYKEISKFLEKIVAEEQKVVNGGKEELAVAKKNVAAIDERYKQYKMLNMQADRLQQASIDNKNVEKSVADAVNEVVKKLREAALEQFDLTKSSREHNAVLKEALAFESKLNAGLKERAALENKLTSLKKKLETELAGLERTKNAKAQYATRDALKAADEEAKRLANDIKLVEKELERVQNIGTVGGNIDTTALNKAKDRVKELNNEFNATSLKVKEIKAQLAGLSSIKWGANILKRAVAYASMYAGIYEVINLMRQGVGTVVEFDTQMRTIEAVFDVTSNQAKILANDLLALGRAWGGSITDINEAALALGRAGIETEKVAEATEVVIKMAKLTGDSIAVSASAVITYQQVFGATHPVLKEVGDQLAYVANQSRLSTQDIGTFSNYALAAASAAGLSMEAINAMATSFSNAGVNASTIGTQIRRFSSLMKDNSTAAKEFFMKLGTTQEAFAAQMQKGKKSADEAMTWMANRLKNLSNSEFQKTIQGMDILASNSITLLRNNADEFLRHFQRLNEGVRGEIDKANLISEGYQASFEKMKIAASQAFISISETAAPVIKDMIDSMAGFFDYIKNNSDDVIKILKGILDTTMWTLLGLVVMKTTILIGDFSRSIVLLGSMMGLNAVKFAAFRTALTETAVAIRAFMATNPVGWALLAASLVGGAALALFDYGDATEDATAKQQKLNEAMAESERLNKRISDNRLELGKVMKSLKDTTKEATQEEINRAAALELSIQKDEQQLKILREKQKLTELQSQVKVKERSVDTLTQEIKLAEAEGNQRLVQQLKARKKRLEEDIVVIKVKYSLEKADSDFKAGVTDLINNYEAQLDRLSNLKINGGSQAEIEGATKALEIYKNRLQDIYGLDIEMFKGKDIEVELEKYLNTTKGKLAALESQLKINPQIGDIDKQAILQKIEEYKRIIQNVGASSLDITREVDLKTFSKFGQAVANQFKAGFDIKPQLEQFYTDYSTAMNKISVQAAVFAEDLNNKLAKSLESIDPNKVDANFYNLMQKLTEAQTEFSKADSAKGKQEALNNMKNILAELKLKYNEVGSEAVKQAEISVKAYDKLGDTVQRYTGELAKTTNNVFNSQKMLEDANKMADSIKGLVSDTKNIDMSYGEIVSKMGQGVDLSWQIRNANLSAAEASNLQIEAKATLIKMEQELIQLGNALNAILANPSYVSEEARGEVLEQINKQIEDAIKKAEAAKKNFKASAAHLKTIKSHSASAAKSAEKQADALERAQRAFKKLEAGYLNMSGDYSMSFSLDYEAEMMKIDEYGKKAKATAADISRVKKEFLDAKSKENNENYINFLSDESGIESQKMILDYQKKQEELKKYYAERKEIILQKEEELKLAKENGAITNEDYEAQRMQLELERQRAFYAEKWSIDNEYYTNLANTVNAGLTDALGFMQNLYDAGIIKSKGWVKAMQAIQVAQAIMTTYSAAVKAYELGWAAGGPFGGPALGAAYAAMAIAKGMAQVAMIKQQKFHTGGYVDKPLSSGIGGQKDDEIMAVLQKGEYVLSKEEVAQIKTKKPVTNAADDTINKDNTKNNYEELKAISESMKPEVVVINSLDSAVMEEWATSRQGREVINNVIKY